MAREGANLGDKAVIPSASALLGKIALQLLLALLVLPAASGVIPGGRMSGLGVVPHGIDVANALAVADAGSSGQKQLIAGTQATIL